MKHYTTFSIIGGLCFLLTTASLTAQKRQQSFYAGIGIATVRGETTDLSIPNEDYGLNYSLKYFLPCEDERWVFTLNGSFTSINLNRDFSQAENMLHYHNSFYQSYLGGGIRYYLSDNINRYNPYKGQILPFVSMSVGGIQTVRNSKRVDNAPATSFKTLVEKNPAQGYEFEEGATYEVNGQFEAGIVYVITPGWRIEASGLARPGFSDTWDGIKGKGPGKDWFVSGGLGMHFQF